MTVPAATGNHEFSVWRSNTQCRVKKLTDSADNIIKRLFIDNRRDFGWGQSAVEAEEVRSETGNVRTGHGSSADGVNLPVRPGGSDVLAGSPDINDGTIIGGVGLRVIDIRIGDSDRLFNAGRRAVDRVLVFVSGGYDDGDTTGAKLKMGSHVSGVPVTFDSPSAHIFNSQVNNGMRSASHAYRNNRRIARSRHLFGDPVNASDTVVR